MFNVYPGNPLFVCVCVNLNPSTNVLSIQFIIVLFLFISASGFIPALGLTVPRAWLILLGNTITQYPLV